MGVIMLPGRPSDLLFCGVYLFFFAHAAFFFLSECKSVMKATAPEGKRCTLVPYVEQVCSKVPPMNLNLAYELDAVWAKDVFTVQGDYILKLVSCALSLVLALPLAIVMLVGWSGNGWQRPAILHASVLLVTGVHFWNAGLAAQPKEKEVFEAAYVFMFLAPLALLYRWWGENSFTSSKGSAVGSLVSFVVSVACLVGLVYVATTVFDWTVDSHKDLKGTMKTRPIIANYTATATKQLKVFSALAADKLEVLGKEVVAKVQELMK